MQDSFLHLQSPLPLRFAVLAESLRQDSPYLILNSVERPSGTLPGSIDRLKTLSGTDFEQLVSNFDDV